MDSSIFEQLRLFPAVHRIIGEAQIKQFIEEGLWSRDQVVEEIGRILESLRVEIIHGSWQVTSDTDVLRRVFDMLQCQIQANLTNVINGTGIILHTNLGRARLPRQAIEHMNEVASQYSNLEYNLMAGQRGSRHDHVEHLVCRLTGAEAAVVVNNNAAAVFLVLRELARDKEVIVSRGELVEIGGSFRVSEIMAESGAKLVEVGTTNKTRIRDYEEHITEETALLLKVHTSNFRIIGFTEEVDRGELVNLAHHVGIPVYEDLGSGVLCDLRQHGIGDEPTVMEVLGSGVDLVSFSGDKLLGGPQAGIIAGKKVWIDRLKKNQLMRMLRVDKVTLAGLEAILRLYLNPEKAIVEIPTLRDLLQPAEVIRQRALRFLKMLEDNAVLSDWHKEVLTDVSEVGGGTLPTVKLPTYVIAFSHVEKGVHRLERDLRLSTPAVIARISNDRLLLDFRTISKEDVLTLIQVFENIDRISNL